jgi:hypothetical protein
MLSTLHVWRVVVFLYMGGYRLLHNLTDMRRKVSASLGLRMAMVPESYQCELQKGIGMVPTSEWRRPSTRRVVNLQGCTYDLEQISLAHKGKA